MSKSKHNVYAIYKGDKFIDVGTIEELSKSTGRKKGSILCMGTPSHRKRVKNYDYDNRLILIKVE